MDKKEKEKIKMDKKEKEKVKMQRKNKNAKWKWEKIKMGARAIKECHHIWSRLVIMLGSKGISLKELVKDNNSYWTVRKALQRKHSLKYV